MAAHPGPPPTRTCGITASGSSGTRIRPAPLSAEVLVRRPWESAFPASVPPTVPCPDIPFPPRGPCSGSPASLVHMRRYDSLPPVPLRFVSFAKTVPCRASRSLLPAGAHRGKARRVGHPVSLSGMLPRRWQGLPGSWVNPDGVHALLSDPGGPSVPGRYGAEGIAFRLLDDVGSSMRSFRGCITRPAPSLSTLRRLGYPNTTQDSLPAGGHPWPGRIEYLQGSP